MRSFSLQIWLLFPGASITYNSRFVPKTVLCKLLNPGYWCRRVLKLLFLLCVHIPGIVSPHPVFRVQLLELHTGVVSGIHTTSYQRQWLEQAQSVATAITQRDTLADFRTFCILHHLHYIVNLFLHIISICIYIIAQVGGQYRRIFGSRLAVLAQPYGGPIQKPRIEYSPVLPNLKSVII